MAGSRARVGVGERRWRWSAGTTLVLTRGGVYFFFFQAEDGIRDLTVTGVQTCALPIFPFEEEDVVAMVRKVFAGRVQFHDGTDQIAPGITVHKIGGHSKGLQCVKVKRSEERRVGKECRSRWSPYH